MLDVRTDPDSDVIRLRLTDEHDRQLGANQVRLSEHSAALWQGLFDTRSYVDTYADSVRFTDRPATAEDLFEKIGVFLGQNVLGSEILAALYPGVYQRSLLVRIAPEDRIAAAFARVPWEIARPAPVLEPLFERNLVVRMETPGASSTYAPPLPGPEEHLRVLLVYAEAPGSRPLAMRLEREQLLGLFYDEVMPKRQVSVDVLCHGVTRAALKEKVREAGRWSHVGVICQNWANALGDVGRLDDAKSTYLRSAEAHAKAGSPRVSILGSELEALRVDVMQGGAERLPEIESRLQEVRDWWHRHRSGEPAPEAPDPVSLARALISGLDIATQANLALEQWEACLDILTEIEEIKRALGAGEHALARTRFNRYGPLLRLDRLNEAQRVLEGCLDIDRGAGDLPGEAADLSALADLW
ncbi:MAG: hypothetical protein ACJ759_23780, partial [Thermoanaerobaculia bacterium]